MINKTTKAGREDMIVVVIRSDELSRSIVPPQMTSFLDTIDSIKD